MELVILDAATLGEDLDLSLFDVYGNVTVYPLSSPEEIKERVGKASVILPYEEQGYYLMETKAPKGYKLNAERFTVSATETNNPPVVFREVRITDQKKTVPTGIAAAGGSGLLISGAVLVLMSGICACIGYFRSRRARG